MQNFVYTHGRVLHIAQELRCMVYKVDESMTVCAKKKETFN